MQTCTGLANYIDNYTGPAGQTGRSFGSPFFSFPQTLQSYYFQDTWKVRPNLTVTYGLRYEFQGTPLNTLPYPTVLPGALAPVQPITQRVTQQADKNNLDPASDLRTLPAKERAFSVRIRLLFAAASASNSMTLFSPISGTTTPRASPTLLGGVLVAPSTGRGSAGALALVNQVTGTLNPRSSVTSIVSNIVNPLIYQWNFSIERALPGKFLVTASYVGTRGERLYLNQELNPGVNGSRINPARGSILARTNLGNSNYNGLALLVNRTLGRGFTLIGSYTWSKSLDNGSDPFTTSSDTTRPQNLFNSSLEKGPSAFDRRQRAVFTWIYRTPTFKPASAAAKVLSWPVRDWQVSGIFSFQTGAPETVYLGGYDQNGDLSAANDRPNLSNPKAAVNHSPACLASTSCITGVGQINPDGSLVDWNTGASGTPNQFRYIVTNVVGAGPNGNLGRNTFYNPGRQDYELALQRIIRIPHLSLINWSFEPKPSMFLTTPTPAAGLPRMVLRFRASVVTSLTRRRF